MHSSNQLVSELKELRLFGIAESLSERLKSAHKNDLGYEDFLVLLTQDEMEHRKNARISRLLKNAGFRQQASLESFEAKSTRGVDRKLMQDLATCRFINESNNIIIMGPTGTGKTYLATALGNTACRRGFTTYFLRMNSMIEQSVLHRTKGSYLNWLKKLSQINLLILDDFGIKPLTPQQYQDLYDILDERGEGKSVILTSQLPIRNWSEIINDPVTCEAITDRLVSRAIKIDLKGESYRKKRGTVSEQDLTKIDPP